MTSIPAGTSAADPKGHPRLDRLAAAWAHWRERRRQSADLRRQLERQRRRVEASRPFEDILVDEYLALEPDAAIPAARYEIAPEDIVDLERIAAFLYESAVHDRYPNWQLSVSGDGPRLALRAWVWNTLSPELQHRLEQIATRTETARGESVSISVDAETRAQLSSALTSLVRIGHGPAQAARS